LAFFLALAGGFDESGVAVVVGFLAVVDVNVEELVFSVLELDSLDEFGVLLGDAAKFCKV